MGINQRLLLSEEYEAELEKLDLGEVEKDSLLGDPICQACNGSGEGPCCEKLCHYCHGRGTIPSGA